MTPFTLIPPKMDQCVTHTVIIHQSAQILFLSIYRQVLNWTSKTNPWGPLSWRPSSTTMWRWPGTWSRVEPASITLWVPGKQPLHQSWSANTSSGSSNMSRKGFKPERIWSSPWVTSEVNSRIYYRVTGARTCRWHVIAIKFSPSDKPPSLLPLLCSPGRRWLHWSPPRCQTGQSGHCHPFVGDGTGGHQRTGGEERERNTLGL